MNVRKKVVLAILSSVIVTALAACGTQNKEAKNEGDTKSVEEKVIGVAPGPYGDMVTDVISPLLEEKNSGYTLTTKVFNDYVQPNKALDKGQIDGNLFQHTAYLEQFATDNDLNLTALQIVPTLGMGIYSKKIDSLEDLKDGDIISIPNDASNLARALLLLEVNQLITLKEDVNVAKATVDDIAENPKKLEFKTLEAAQLVRSQDTVTTALVPGNFSWAAKLDPADALALEDLAEDYKNVFVVTTDAADSDFAQAVKEVLESQEFKDAIAESSFKDFSKPEFWSE
ncbi:MetQ/NlpA family ABC transporter substrate-binding protein [Vagococcus elongatus]|uniref:Lipoprotein n=1 Tax=Vagococcus elongatus TaxID=180344 RepID=A0A430AV73_9ENTE|nr:MetQ/NlpA family ABC transporter substrate-binding protein [Vagococcus elongatus]RSU11953.1 amino acid ABC transporter substrate-binding protein [Vagococcus elongatus]